MIGGKEVALILVLGFSIRPSSTLHSDRSESLKEVVYTVYHLICMQLGYLALRRTSLMVADLELGTM